ncbi:hypothetical protein NHX12_018497 [Muraenolepis orangiensis]|uniref:AAA+ ATPase domain-containing protein n=1 Tax=Muraenolepis orangiensis TaxID=630683 RepID=A0A9Q0EZT9_9TELE|nr:hypothetical protein NHX12_018497 [Muraenolepis orangiensis]
MDEYDEMYGIEDDYDQQFADELEVLAELDEVEPTKRPGVQRNGGTGIQPATTPPAPPPPSEGALQHLLHEPPISPKAKRQKQDAGVVKRLFGSQQTDEVTAPTTWPDDITPPSSPERYESTRTFRSTPAVLDVSGFAAFSQTPPRPAGVAASQCVLKRPPLDGEYITVTDPLGTRVYLRQKEDTGERLVDPRRAHHLDGGLGLLSEPIEVLRKQVTERRNQQVLEEFQRLTEMLARYSPHHYTELLSDDFTNRCLLKWLKLWDTVVFGRERKVRPPPADRHAQNQNTSNPNQAVQNANFKTFKTKSQITEEILEAELDQYKRPKFKVAMLSGPPGLGKTTLAHVIAKHAGYNVVEINASDDRSAEVFQKRLNTATQMIYGPALRPLRQQAFLLAFPQTQPSRLTQRLAEGMKADTGTLMALCDKTDNDIRSCINTLQFLHGRGQRTVDTQTVQNVAVGQKDQNKGLFHLWQETFQLPRLKRKRVGQGFEEGPGQGGGGERFQNILLLASSSGEFDKVSQGLYDNFLSMRVRDPHMHAVCEGLQWLSFSDQLNHVIMSGQNFSLMRYLPFLSVTFHFLFAHAHVPRLIYPHSQYEATTRLQGNRNALSAMLAEIPPSVRSRVSEQSLTADVLTLLLDIICPKLRPVNPQLFSTREKQQMKELIDTMLAYNLSYRQDRTPEGQYTYVLEPRQLTYQAKQTISREMEQERMRRAEQLMLLRNPASAQVPPPEKAKSTSDPKPSKKNHQQRLENIVRQTTVEIRVQDCTSERSVEQSMGTAVGNSDVWFRFNEGVSNAVRRNVHIRELL